MRTLNKNKQKMYYALYSSATEQYETNSQGTIQYVIIDGQSVPVELGTKTEAYATPIAFRANIAFSGDSDLQNYGVSVGDYDAIIKTDRGKYPIKETSLIWYESTPVYVDQEQKVVDPKSADYEVTAVLNSLNYSTYVLRRCVKNENTV